jgi:hypothetical protein
VACITRTTGWPAATGGMRTRTRPSTTVSFTCPVESHRASQRGLRRCGPRPLPTGISPSCSSTRTRSSGVRTRGARGSSCTAGSLAQRQGAWRYPRRSYSISFAGSGRLPPDDRDRDEPRGRPRPAVIAGEPKARPLARRAKPSPAGVTRWSWAMSTGTGSLPVSRRASRRPRAGRRRQCRARPLAAPDR